jgi:hypothetical protein
VILFKTLIDFGSGKLLLHMGKDKGKVHPKTGHKGAEGE